MFTALNLLLKNVLFSAMLHKVFGVVTQLGGSVVSYFSVLLYNSLLVIFIVREIISAIFIGEAPFYISMKSQLKPKSKTKI